MTNTLNGRIKTAIRVIEDNIQGLKYSQRNLCPQDSSYHMEYNTYQTLFLTSLQIVEALKILLEPEEQANNTEFGVK